MRNDVEKLQLEKLILNLENSPRLYLKEGQLEPVQLLEEERDLLIDGMQSSLAKIAQEVLKSNELTLKITGKPSLELEVRRQEIFNLQKEFCSLLAEKPEVL